MKIYVKVKPCSLRNFLEKIGESDFRAEVKAPAEKGKANDARRKLIAKEGKFEGFAATVVQHEMDHLEGKIFVERILEQDERLYKVTGSDKKGKEIWEEVEL